MSCAKSMLTVLMDGITDANMWLDYAVECSDAGNTEHASWFRNHAKKRIDALDGICEYVFEEIGLAEKVKAGDEIAKALKDHIETEVEKLRTRLAAV